MRQTSKALILTTVLFGLITAAQFIAAAIAQSEALLIDSVSMLADTSTYAINLCAARCHRDIAELIAAGISITVLVGASIWGISEAVHELVHPDSDQEINPDIVLAFGLWGIVFDCVSCVGFYRWGRRDVLHNRGRSSHDQFLRSSQNNIEVDTGKEGNSILNSSTMNLSSAFMHVGADCLRSVIIVVEGLAVKIEGQGRTTDSIAALIVSATILIAAFGAIAPWLSQYIAWQRRCAAKASKADLNVMAQQMCSTVEAPAATSIGVCLG